MDLWSLWPFLLVLSAGSHSDLKKVIGSIMLNDAVAAYNNAIIKREHDEVKAIF